MKLADSVLMIMVIPVIVQAGIMIGITFYGFIMVGLQQLAL